MSQIFDITKPISGTTKLSQLYQIIRDHDQANKSSFSGTTAPAAPVVGQLWEDTVNDKLFLYTAASGWSEVAVENIGLGLELKTARGSHASLDSRLDAQLNEDGTLKAATTLNPSQWYDLTVASGYVSTTSFRAYGADYTTVYYPTRRLKVNTPGAVYTEVVSSSYSAPNTTVVVRDAVVTTGLVSVSHSIVGPRKASAGDGAVSYEMVANRNVASPVTEYTVLVGDSVVMASGTFTVHGIAGGSFGPGRPLFFANIGTGTITYDPGAYSINGSTTDLTLAAGQTLLIYPSGDNWRRADQPNSLASATVIAAAVLSGAFTGTYTLGGTPTITEEAWKTPTLLNSWENGGGGTQNARYLKDPLGWVKIEGYVVNGIDANIFDLDSNYRPSGTLYFLQSGLIGLTDSAIHVTIDSSGNVSAAGSPSIVSLAGITFKAA